MRRYCGSSTWISFLEKGIKTISSRLEKESKTINSSLSVWTPETWINSSPAESSPQNCCLLLLVGIWKALSAETYFEGVDPLVFIVEVVMQVHRLSPTSGAVYSAILTPCNVTDETGEKKLTEIIKKTLQQLLK